MTCPNCGATVYQHTQICPRCQAQLLPPPSMPAPAGYPYAGGTEAPDQPEWVRVVQGQAYAQQQNPPPAPAPRSRNGAPGYAQVPPPQQPQGSLSLSEMINEENLPEWLRGAADAPDAPARPQAPQAPRNAGGGMGYAGYPANYPASGYSAYAVDPRPTGNMAIPSVPPPYPSPPAGAPGASAASLLDESALPDWLRQASMNGANGAIGQQGGGAPQAPQAQRMPYMQQGQSAQGMAAGYPDAQMQAFSQPEPSSAFPRIDQANYGQQPAPFDDQNAQGGMAAQSLLDPRALPGWLGGDAATPYTPQHNERAGMGMPANSLVDEHALPQWLRNEPATPSQRVPAVQPGAVSQWITGASDEPLPTWLNQVYSDAQPAPPAAFTPAQPFARPVGAPAYAQSPESAAQPFGMTARQFVEESALPEWLRAQGAPPAPAAPGNGYGAPPFSAPGVPGDQFTYRSSQPASGYLAPAAPFAGAAGGMSGQLQAAEPEIAPEATFSAYDLIDPDALPSWVHGGPRSNGAGAANATNATNATNGRIPAAANGANGANGAFGRASAASGWDEETNEPPITPTSRRPATLGQTMSRSGRVPVPPTTPAPQGRGQRRAPSDQTSAGRMRLDDPSEGARNPPRQQAAGRPAPQRAPGTGSLRQPPPEQRLNPEELPGWLRAGAAHVAPPEAGYGYNGYSADYAQNGQYGSGVAGFPDSAQEEPIWDDADWGLPPSGNSPQGGQSSPYTARGRAPQPGQRPPASDAHYGGTPDDRRKRGWRRIFGR